MAYGKTAKNATDKKETEDKMLLLQNTTMKDFFRELYWVVFLLILILAVGIIGQLNGGDMDMYLKAQRINNG